MKYNTSVSFWIAREKTHCVEVKAWYCDDKWMWNIYAHVFESHPFFNDHDKLLGLPFNCDCTFDRTKTEEPLNGVERGWERKTISKVVGSDYAHIYDDYDNHPAPFENKDGEVPHPFLGDAEQLAEALNNALNLPSLEAPVND